MSSTRYAEFSITTGAGTSTFRVDDRQFTTFPIEAAITTEVAYSLVGSPIVSGNFYDGRVLWTGAQFLIPRSDYPALSGLVRRQELRRRNRLDYAIAFKNVLYPFVDANSTRTRAIATGSVTTNADGTIQYFAEHNVAIVQFSVDPNGSYYSVSMDWQELDLSA